MPPRLSEELTRKEMIDPQLEKAGWYLNPKIKHINSNNKVSALRQLHSASGLELRTFFGRTLTSSPKRNEWDAEYFG
jgi:hypothetical protein